MHANDAAASSCGGRPCNCPYSWNHITARDTASERRPQCSSCGQPPGCWPGQARPELTAERTARHADTWRLAPPAAAKRAATSSRQASRHQQPPSEPPPPWRGPLLRALHSLWCMMAASSLLLPHQLRQLRQLQLQPPAVPPALSPQPSALSPQPPALSLLSPWLCSFEAGRCPCRTCAPSQPGSGQLG
jgi:hypothetical protein